MKIIFIYRNSCKIAIGGGIFADKLHTPQFFITEGQLFFRRGGIVAAQIVNQSFLPEKAVSKGEFSTVLTEKLVPEASSAR